MAKLDKATDKRIQARARSWTRAQIRHEANRKANEAQHQANLDAIAEAGRYRSDVRPSKQVRTLRRAGVAI